MRKPGLCMYTKYTYSYYSTYLTYCLRFWMRFPMKSCINIVNIIGLL